MHEGQEHQEEAGFVTQAKEYLITLEGLPSIRINDIIESEGGDRAIVTGLLDERVEALLLDRVDVRVNERFFHKSNGISFPLSDALIGRIMSPIGDALDGKGIISQGKASVKLEVTAPGMNARGSITRQFETGITSVDTLLPLSFGQRQLVVGPTGSGMTLFLEDVVLRQRGTPVLCIYTLIGKPPGYVDEIVSRLTHKEGSADTILLIARSEEVAPMIAISPSIAFSIAEFFSSHGRDVLLVLDDLGTHAKYLREIALLSGRFPGRESYPGDIFYQHAHLMERAGQFNKVVGGGSITLLPVLETGVEDLTNLISTNLMAATDGHFFFLPELYAQGIHPALSVLQSVTRIGRKTQNQLSKELSFKIMALLSDYEKQQEFSRFGTQLSEETRKTLERGDHIKALLKQQPFVPRTLETHIILLTLPFTPLLSEKPVLFTEANKSAIIEVVSKSAQLEELRKSARRGTVSWGEFLKRLIKEIPVIEAVCRR